MTVYRGEANPARKIAGEKYARRQLERRPANSGVTATGSSLPFASFTDPGGGVLIPSGVATFVNLGLMNNEFDPGGLFSISGAFNINCNGVGTNGAIYLCHATIIFPVLTTGYRFARWEQSGGVRGTGVLPNEVLATQNKLSVTGNPMDHSGGSSIAVQLVVYHTQGAGMTITLLGGIWRTSFS